MRKRSLLYPCLGDSPTLFVNIINCRTKRPQIFQMLLDSGASRTCLPANRAAFLGHDNNASHVKTAMVQGVGGKSNAFIHTLRFELIDPEGKTWTRLIPPWRSSVMPVLFVDKMETQSGIIGRDVLALWNQTCFRPTPKSLYSRWTVEIQT